MDVNQQQNPPMSGDDELAKALEGGLQFEETPVPGNAPNPAAPVSQAPTLSSTPPPANNADAQMPSLDPNGGEDAPDDKQEPETEAKAEPKEPTPKPEVPAIQHHTKNHASAPKSAKTEPVANSSGLDKLKASALEELRPLVGKLKLPAEEKFDTLLLIIRTTDDQSLLDEAHTAAKEIGDETRRAQALLDVIKEIDYFSSKR